MSEENIDPTRKDRWKKYKQDKIRWGTWSTREEYEEITAKAQECALTFNEYVRRCALGRRTIHKTDSAYINTLAKLGGLQNKIMSEINERFDNREFEQIAPLVAEARKIVVPEKVFICLRLRLIEGVIVSPIRKKSVLLQAKIRGA